MYIFFNVTFANHTQNSFTQQYGKNPKRNAGNSFVYAV